MMLRLLCRALVTYFKQWRGARLEALAATASGRTAALPPFNPPKPSMVDGLRNLIDFFNVRMCAEDFRAGVKRAFVSTGLVPSACGELTLPTCVLFLLSSQAVCGCHCPPHAASCHGVVCLC
jgi:hypothetical protein